MTQHACRSLTDQLKQSEEKNSQLTKELNSKKIETDSAIVEIQNEAQKMLDKTAAVYVTREDELLRRLQSWTTSGPNTGSLRELQEALSALEIAKQDVSNWQAHAASCEDRAAAAEAALHIGNVHICFLSVSLLMGF